MWRRAAMILVMLGGRALAGEPLAEQARGELQPRCGSCHDSRLETAKPRALAVFDLSRERWYETIGDGQLDKLLGRLKGMDAPDDVRARVEAFIAAERARRRKR